MKPHSEACERNKQPILDELKKALGEETAHVLEIGSGTGQHAAFFAAHLPRVTWQTSDLPEHHRGIQMWIEETDLPNLRAPLALDVTEAQWPLQRSDAVFCANVIHIVAWRVTQALFAGVGKILKSGDRFFTYGPYNLQGQFTSESNARFDQWLRARNPEWGIRDLEALTQLGEASSLFLQNNTPMPANNRFLTWQKG